MACEFKFVRLEVASNAEEWGGLDKNNSPT